MLISRTMVMFHGIKMYTRDEIYRIVSNIAETNLIISNIVSSTKSKRLPTLRSGVPVSRQVKGVRTAPPCSMLYCRQHHISSAMWLWAMYHSTAQCFKCTVAWTTRVDVGWCPNMAHHSTVQYHLQTQRYTRVQCNVFNAPRLALRYLTDYALIADPTWRRRQGGISWRCGEGQELLVSRWTFARQLQGKRASYVFVPVYLRLGFVCSCLACWGCFFVCVSRRKESGCLLITVADMGLENRVRLLCTSSTVI